MIKIVDEIYDLISLEIDKHYLEPYRKEFSKSLNEESFKISLKSLILENKYDALSLMELLNPIYKNYWEFTTTEGLKYIFDWALSLSYPEKVTIKTNNKFTPLVLLYLNILRIFSSYEIKYDKNSFLSKYPLHFLTYEEEKESKFIDEYLKFKNTFLNNWIYELMKIDLALTNHNTIDHVIGVNYLSLYIGRQIKKIGLPIDLGIVVGSALGHDIGKYGVRNEDIHRVPYLHYFYTEKWFKRFGIEKIGHIATNHSTWDLELENLPLESLILIYSDFRVKNIKENNEYKMHIYSLKEAYDVILNKLDNLDAKKEQRYGKVYKKLKDFENYLLNLGIDTKLINGDIEKKDINPYPLMDNKEIVENIKYFAIEHNIELMAKLLDNTNFNNILESARSEYNWRKLRLYLQIFREYSTYLTQKQKMVTLYFLSDLLFHKEEDIRKESAELIGLLISHYDEEYRKEIPHYIKKGLPEATSENILDELVKQMLYPDHKIVESHIEWQYNLKTIISSLFNNSSEDNYKKYTKILIEYYDDFISISPISQLYLSQTIKYIPIHSLDKKDLDRIHAYIINQLNSDILEIRLTTLDIIDEIYEELKDEDDFIQLLINWILVNIEPSSNAAENYLKLKLAQKLQLEQSIVDILIINYKKDEENISEIFLKNLKTATEWMNKKVNIDILYDQVKKSPTTIGLHTGMHFCNLLKVSAVEKVRNYAGYTLLNIFEFLSLGERNDICIELLRALEMQNYQFTKYIPSYLGQLLLYLQPTELDEIVDDFEEKIKQSNVQIVFLLLNTVGVCIENYPQYCKRFRENKEENGNRLNRLLGILLSGMASFDDEIKTESFRIIGSLVFGSNKLSLEEKHNIFSLIGKKVLTMLTHKEDDEFIFLNNSASLNHIYRFILDYEFYNGDIQLISKEKVAFFPGSFDPFSLSHKEIALEIMELGFEVYLAVDEFSWSKRTQPHKHRWDIINMTIAHEKDIFLFPSEIPINISNDRDLANLKSLFKGRDVYIVVGTDVLINASAYSKDGLLTSFHHIIFDRINLSSKEDDEFILERRLKGIKGQILRLSLPPQYEEISSTRIRESIDLNRDISKQIDTLAQQYIYEYGLYLNEPQYKSLVQTKTFETEIVENVDNNLLEYLDRYFGQELNMEAIYSLRTKIDPTILLIKESKTNTILGFSIFYWVKSSMLYSEFKDTNIAEYFRNNSKGKLVLIGGLYSKYTEDSMIEIILNETLAYCTLMDYNYAIFNNSLRYKENGAVEDNLILQGFIKTPFCHDNNPIFMVDMNNPMTLSQDLESLLKPPFDKDQKVQKIIHESRRQLKKSLSNLYPGELLLSFNRDMIYSKLIEKICDTNQVPIIQKEKRVLGPHVCVPFGSILNGSILPNTITKTMHTEKIFNPSIDNFTIGAYPNYLSLENQSKVLYSFDKSIILLDDLLHKGYRLNVIEPLLRQNNVDIKKIIVGILTGRGKDIAEIKGIDVDCAYFIPNLKLWFNESHQYPFIGGDMVQRENIAGNYLIPSINLILPYVSPTFVKNTPAKAIYKLSETCLINAIKIFQVIEMVYQEMNEKNLLLRGLGEVLVSPRKPDIYRSMDYYNNLKPSSCLETDLEHLRRIENLVHK